MAEERKARFLRREQQREMDLLLRSPSREDGEDLVLPSVLNFGQPTPRLPTRPPDWSTSWRRMEHVATPPRDLIIPPVQMSRRLAATVPAVPTVMTENVDSTGSGEKQGPGIVPNLENDKPSLECIVRNLAENQSKLFEILAQREKVNIDREQALEDKIAELSQNLETLNVKSSGAKPKIESNVEVRPPALKLETVKMPTFCGVMDSIGPSQFLKDLDLLKQSHDFSDDVFIRSWLPSLLRRGASAWFVQHKSEFATWEIFKTAFMRRFKSRRHNFDILSALRSIKQGDDESFSKYFARCESLLLQADDTLTDDFKVGAIVEGLTPRLYHKVMHIEFSSIEELCEVVSSIENKLKLWRSDTRPKDKRNGQNSDGKGKANGVKSKRLWCSLHRMFGHSDDQCYKNKKVSSGESKDKSNYVQGQSKNGNRQSGARPKDYRNFNQNFPDRIPKPVYSNNPAFQAVVQGGLDPSAPIYYSNYNSNAPPGQADC